MPGDDISIMIVDDAKFSSAVISRAIKNGGYSDVRHTTNARDALSSLEERSASILIADWLMPEMDGLEMTQHIRQLDEEKNHYTYIILLTAKEGVDALKTAFDEGVDDFVNKSAMNQQLLPRIFAAERLVSNQNRLLIENQRLIDANTKLKKISTLDPLTGFGNQQYALRKLGDTLKHARSRNGAACLLIINITGFEQFSNNQKPIANQVVLGISRRLRQLVRPLDILARTSVNQFVIITHQPSLSNCTANSFKRIHDGINLKAIKTSAGFISVNASISIAAADNDTGLPAATELLSLAREKVEMADNAGVISVSYWDNTPSQGVS